MPPQKKTKGLQASPPSTSGLYPQLSSVFASAPPRRAISDRRTTTGPRSWFRSVAGFANRRSCLVPAHRSVLRGTIERRASFRCFAVLPLLGLLTLVGVTVEGQLPYSSYSVTTIRRTTVDSKETANGLRNSNGILQPTSQSEMTQMRPLIPPATGTDTRTDDFAPTPTPTPSAAAITTQPSDNAVTEAAQLHSV